GQQYRREVLHIISALIIGPSYLTWRELKHLKHIGPIRDVPSRDLHEVLSDSDLSWNRGLAAWNYLFRGGPEFVNRVGEWLRREDRLNTGYGLRVQNVIELADDVLIARILEGDGYSALDLLQQRIRETPKRK